MSPGDQERQDREAEELATVLSAGALPGPLRELSTRKLPAP
jgi:hypothetical protein